METSHKKEEEAQGVQQQKVGGVTKFRQQAPSTLQLPFQQKMLKAGRMTNNRRSHCTLAEYESTGCVLLKFPHGGNNQETGL
jgi:hypothetical protein